jgi:hypothetical protein
MGNGFTCSGQGDSQYRVPHIPCINSHAEKPNTMIIIVITKITRAMNASLFFIFIILLLPVVFLILLVYFNNRLNNKVS